MEIKNAVNTLGALAQETRLAVFRLLVRCGPEGLAAGEIARMLGVPHNTLSVHLNILSRAGLLVSRRQSRSVIYSVDFTGVRDLLMFLTQDCCQGNPAVCEPLIDAVLADGYKVF